MEVQFDQHFLKSEGALYQIVKAVETSSEDNICEIGAGNCVLRSFMSSLVQVGLQVF